MKITKYIVLILFLGVIFGCKPIRYYSDETNPIVAELGYKKLYLKDISFVFENKTRNFDSVDAANDYVDTWIRNQIKITEAEKLFENNQKDIDILVERYRNSLLLTKYDNYHGSEVDTYVSDKDIVEYYNKNKYQFKLSSAVVKARVLVMPEQYKYDKKLIKRLYTPTDDGYQDVLSISSRDNLSFYYFDEDWVYFSDVLKYIPLKIKTYNNYLWNNSSDMVVDKNNRYFIKIFSYRRAGGYMPLSFVHDDIKKLIVNKRRGDIFKNIVDSVYVNVLEKDMIYQLNIDSSLLKYINIEK